MAERRRYEEDDEDEDDRPRRRGKKNPHEADFYKVTAGMTTALGVHDHGEIVKHEDMGPGFNPIHPDEQEDRFGRVMYTPHTPSDDERRRLGLGHAVKAGPSPQQEAEAEEREEEGGDEVTEPKQLKDMDDDELHAMVQAEGLSLPRETPRHIMEGALAKHMREQEEQQRKVAAEHKTTEPKKGRNGGHH